MAAQQIRRGEGRWAGVRGGRMLLVSTIIGPQLEVIKLPAFQPEHQGSQLSICFHKESL